MVGEEEGGLTDDAVDGGVRLMVLGGILGHSVSLSPSGWRLLPVLKVRQEKEDEMAYTNGEAQFGPEATKLFVVEGMSILVQGPEF